MSVLFGQVPVPYAPSQDDILPGGHEPPVLKPVARASDPETSKAAAVSISRELGGRHKTVLFILGAMGQATDDELAERVLQTELTTMNRHEQVRRVIRTIREDHDLMVPVLDEDGNHLQARNISGRMARVWTVREGVTL